MDEAVKNNLLSYLEERHRGRRQAVKAKNLAFRFQTTLREINSLIRQLRKEGFLIGSAKEPPFGYYIPADHAELEEYLDSFKGELFDMLKTFNAQRRARKNFIERQNQPSLFKENEAGQLELAEA